MGDGPGCDDALFGLRGFRVVVSPTTVTGLYVNGQVNGRSQPVSAAAPIEAIRQGGSGCLVCGVIARTMDRLRAIIRDLHAFGRTAKLV